MATYTVKCTKCGTKFSTTSDMAGLTGRSTCPDCKRDENRAKSSAKTSSNSNVSEQTQPIIIKKGPSADEIIAEAQAEQIEYELSKKKKEDSASKPWMFDSNFSSANTISKISFPDTANDVEKTILRIVKTAIDKIKTTVNSHEMGIGEVQVGTKDFLKPFSEEFEFVDTCIEKAKDGLKKLRRFEGSTINVMIQDCQDEIDDLTNKWYPKLVEKREKKKKKNFIVVGVMLLIVITFFTWASLS